MAIRWCCVALGVLLPALAWAEGTRATVEVRGQGEVQVPADCLPVRFSVLTGGTDVREVKTRNDQLCRQIAEVVQSQKLPRPTLRTTNLTVEFHEQAVRRIPRQHSSSKGEDSFEVEAVPPIHMSRNVEVSCQDMQQVVGLLAEVTSWEAMQKTREVRVAPIVPEVTDPKPPLAEARRLAVADARDRAGQLVEAAGQKLGKLQQIVEESARYDARAYPTTGSRYSPDDPFGVLDPCGGREEACPVRLVGLRAAEASEGFDIDRLPPAQVSVSVAVKVVFEVE